MITHLHVYAFSGKLQVLGTKNFANSQNNMNKIRPIHEVLCIQINIQAYNSNNRLSYGMKYWQKLYLADSLFFDFFPRLVDYNLADQSRSSTSHANIHTSLAEFNLPVLSHICQSAKLTSPPIFHAIGI